MLCLLLFFPRFRLVILRFANAFDWKYVDILNFSKILMFCGPFVDSIHVFDILIVLL